ncbi:prolyl oligopeptidase family serine peptidase [Cumulibacter manganitolerans]|uniref:prolyl oligopeptidase family serine peptidase n=1 Tax=Cumulibacter manganitolerans TaxID=1884992 RepID=UPI0012961195|nr:prolyl oligopeptidase family serine peptidase [Cumulibacter manganitolerans]
MHYPQAHRGDTTSEVQGRLVADPYRWLEEPASAQTRDWISAQNELSAAYLRDLPERAWFERRLSALMSRPRSGTPYRKGGRYFVSRNDGTQAQDVWCWAPTLEKLEAGGRVLVDPNRLDESGNRYVTRTGVSENARYFAYALSEGGSDWQTIRVRDIDEKRDLDDELTQSKFGAPTWLPDNASLVYLHYPSDRVTDGTDCGRQPGGVLKVHRLGTPQADDEVVFDSEGDCRILALPEVSWDGRWLIVEIHDGTSANNRLWAYPLRTGERTVVGEPVRMFDEADARYDSVRVIDDTMLVRTDRDAPRYRLVRVPIAAGVTTMETVIGEHDGILESVTSAGGALVTVHLEDAMPVLHRYALDGRSSSAIPMAGAAVVALNGRSEDTELFVGMTSAITPLKSFRVDLESFDIVKLRTAVRAVPGRKQPLWQPPKVKARRETTRSADGTAVSYSILYRDDLDLSTPRPTILYGYGGFNVPMLAEFRPGWPAWLEAGGLVVLANLRGGGEYGAAWHVAGCQAHKQNVFDDFIAVAEDLVARRVTTSAQLALHGRSNGGLLVGAVMTQRPDLAAVALPMVGVLDMLRFHLFTVGDSWTSDYGSPEDPAMAPVLLSYSPLHNVREGTHYPATLVLTGDHDDRVVPAHSYKFTAALQHAQGGPEPVLARIETHTGHGAGKPRAMVAAEWADLLAFAAHHTGLRPQ